VCGSVDGEVRERGGGHRIFVREKGLDVAGDGEVHDEDGGEEEMTEER
jgi:hypothetical protein